MVGVFSQHFRLRIKSYYQVSNKFNSFSDTHHTLSPQEVRDDLFVDVVHQTSGTLVVIACINQELLAGVFINEWTHLRTEAEANMSHERIKVVVLAASIKEQSRICVWLL